MAHPFSDKLFAFIGEPKRCTRQAARDALDAVGGVTDERILSFTSYVVAFNHNGKTDKYKRALHDNEKGYLTLLDEDQFFDILEGKAEPPQKPKRNNVVFANPSLSPEEETLKFDQDWKDILDRKRMNNMARYGASTSDGGRSKIDLRPLDTLNRVVMKMKDASNGQ